MVIVNFNSITNTTKTKYQARSSYETIHFSMMINSSSDGSRWDGPLFPFSPHYRCDMFVNIINIMNIAIISTIITNSVTKVEFDFSQCNTRQ